MFLVKIEAARLDGSPEAKFKLELANTDKLLDFYSEQGNISCWVLRKHIKDIPIQPYTWHTYVVLECGAETPILDPKNDLKFIKILPPRWALFEIFNLDELGKQGVEGFNFEYPGLLRDAGDLWKSIAKAEVEKNA